MKCSGSYLKLSSLLTYLSPAQGQCSKRLFYSISFPSSNFRCLLKHPRRCTGSIESFICWHTIITRAKTTTITNFFWSNFYSVSPLHQSFFKKSTILLCKFFISHFLLASTLIRYLPYSSIETSTGHLCVTSILLTPVSNSVFILFYQQKC